MKTLLYFAWTVAIAGAALDLGGCSTVHQSLVTSKAIVVTPQPVKDDTGYRLTRADRDRYNALIEVYGAAKFDDGAPVFVPALKKDQGVTPAADPAYPFHMTFAARVDFAELKAMQKMAFPVTK